MISDFIFISLTFIYFSMPSESAVLNRPRLIVKWMIFINVHRKDKKKKHVFYLHSVSPFAEIKAAWRIFVMYGVASMFKTNT